MSLRYLNGWAGTSLDCLFGLRLMNYWNVVTLWIETTSLTWCLLSFTLTRQLNTIIHGVLTSHVIFSRNMSLKVQDFQMHSIKFSCFAVIKCLASNTLFPQASDWFHSSNYIIFIHDICILLKWINTLLQTLFYIYFM